MLPKYSIILSLCFLSNCYLVTCDCDSLYDCVGTFFRDFTEIASNKEVNGTKISVLDVSNVEGANNIVNDIKNLENQTVIKEKSANILTFDFNKYFNYGLKAAEDFFKLNLKNLDEKNENSGTDIKRFNYTKGFNFNHNLTEEIYETKYTQTIIDHMTPNLTINFFNLPINKIEEQNNTQEWQKVFSIIDRMLKNNSKTEEQKPEYMNNTSPSLKQNMSDESKTSFRETSLNTYISFDIPSLFKGINNTEINAENADKILDDIMAKLKDSKLNTISKIELPEKNNTVSEENGNLNNLEAQIIITKTIIAPFTSTNISKDQNIKTNDNIFDYLSDYYQDVEDNSTDYPLLDYIELYKDTTNEKVNYNPTEANIVNVQETSNSTDDEYIDNFIADTSNVILINTSKLEEIPFRALECNDKSRSSKVEDAVFPWVVTIFTRNDSTNQFTYICDGALLSNTKILTAAQCVSERSSAFNPEDLLVFAGKRSLQKIDLNEKAYKIKNILLNDNYTNNASLITNDLALLETTEVVEFNAKIQSVCHLDAEYSGKILEEVTSAWDGHGSLVPVALRMINCTEKNETQNNTYCTTYYKDVTGCPSFGGLHAVKTENNNWYLKGVFSDDITKRSPFCMQRNFSYTSLKTYAKWLSDSFMNK